MSVAAVLGSASRRKSHPHFSPTAEFWQDHFIPVDDRSEFAFAILPRVDFVPRESYLEWIHVLDKYLFRLPGKFQGERGFFLLMDRTRRKRRHVTLVEEIS